MTLHWDIALMTLRFSSAIEYSLQEPIRQIFITQFGTNFPFCPNHYKCSFQAN